MNFNNYSKKTKIIIGAVATVLVVALAVGGSIAISNAIKKNKQSKCNHVYDKGVIKAEATCEDPGMLVYTCGECEYELTEEIPANGHVNTVIEAVPATCTAKGLTDGVQCVTCDKVLVAPVETPMLGHKLVSLKPVAATCLTAGKTEGTQCGRCNEILKEQTVIPAKGHNVVEVKGVEATCTTEGKTNGSMCSSCGKVYSEQEAIPAFGHDIVGGTCASCGLSSAELYADYAEKKVVSGATAPGIYRIYKDVSGSDYEGLFLSLKVDFSYKAGTNSNQDYNTKTVYLGVLAEGKLAVAFEPLSNAIGMVYLTEENTTIKFYETSEYYDIVISEGDTITFDGGYAYGGEMVGTLVIDSIVTVSGMGDKVYELEVSTSAVNTESAE